jgi:hypothetical protein
MRSLLSSEALALESLHYNRGYAKGLTEFHDLLLAWLEEEQLPELTDKYTQNI